MAAYKKRKFPSRGSGPAPESRQTDPAPIRATVPLIEQYYVAVDRQLKSGFGTYEAAEKAITGIVGCYARAASGDAAEAVIPLMKSRRRIAFTKAGTTPNRTDYSRDLRTTKWGSGSSCTAATVKLECPLCAAGSTDRRNTF